MNTFFGPACTCGRLGDFPCPIHPIYHTRYDYAYKQPCGVWVKTPQTFAPSPPRKHETDPACREADRLADEQIQAAQKRIADLDDVLCDVLLLLRSGKVRRAIGAINHALDRDED